VVGQGGMRGGLFSPVLGPADACAPAPSRPTEPDRPPHRRRIERRASRSSAARPEPARVSAAAGSLRRTPESPGDGCHPAARISRGRPAGSPPARGGPSLRSGSWRHIGLCGWWRQWVRRLRWRERRGHPQASRHPGLPGCRSRPGLASTLLKRRAVRQHRRRNRERVRHDCFQEPPRAIPRTTSSSVEVLVGANHPGRQEHEELGFGPPFDLPAEKPAQERDPRENGNTLARHVPLNVRQPAKDRRMAVHDQELRLDGSGRDDGSGG